MSGKKGPREVRVEMKDMYGNPESSFDSLHVAKVSGKSSPRGGAVPTPFASARDAMNSLTVAPLPAHRKHMTWANFLTHIENVKNSTQIPDPVYTRKSLFLFEPQHALRKAAIKLVHHPWFDRFILFLIVLNCGFMMATAPYAPCCRPGETLSEGGGSVSSYSETRDGYSCDATSSVSGAKTFVAVDNAGRLNLTGKCQNANSVVGSSKGSEGQTMCHITGYLKYRSVRDRKDAFPDHPQGTYPDANWPWVQTEEKCCVPESWAVKNGIYQSQLPDFEKLYPNVSGHNQDVYVLQPQLCASYQVLDVTFYADWVFTGMFTFECIAKIIARGFILEKSDLKMHMPGAYLRDVWNWLDLIVVISAWWGLFAVTVVRSFRILRPLRGLNKWPSMKILVRSLLRAVPPMKYVAYLMAFLLLVFGIIGTQLWNGLLHGQCHYWDPNDTVDGPWVADPGQDGMICGLSYIPVTEPSYAEAVKHGATVSMSGDKYTQISELLYMPIDSTGRILYNNNALYWDNEYSNATTVARIGEYFKTGRTCEARTYGNRVWSTDILANLTLLSGQKVEIPTMACRFGPNPNYNLSSFDNLLQAVLWIFASITLEGWVDSMYAVNQAWLFNTGVGTFFVEGVYYTLLYLIGSMFMLNLTLAVIWEEFENEHARQEEDEVELILAELKILQRKGYTVESREEGEAAFRRERREAEVQAQLTGDPVPEPWTKKPCIVDGWYALSIHPWFGYFITIHIIVNTVTMALESHDWQLFRKTFNWAKSDVYMQHRLAGEALSQPQNLTLALQVLNYYFSSIFFIEAIIKLIGLSPSNYFKDGFNCFDFSIVLFSITEILLEALNMNSITGLSVLRSFRLLRVLKLAKAWKTLQDLIRTILAAISDVFVAGCLLLVIMVIFTFLGMEIFGGNWNADTFGSADEVPRANFDDFFNAFMAVFQVLTGENWNDLLWAGYKTTGTLGWAYFIALTFVGNYMIFNLFLAILLSKFDENEARAKLDKQDLLKESEKEAADRKRSAQLAAKMLSPAKAKSFGRVSPESIGDKSNQENNDTIKEVTKERTKGNDRQEMVCVGDSLFLFKPDNNIRKMAFRLASNKRFDHFILVVILVSSLLLALDEPWVSACACYNPDVDAADSIGDENGLDTEGNPKILGTPGPSWSIACTSEVPQAWAVTTGSMDGNSIVYYNVLLYSDLIITIIFTFEMTLKIFALGFAFHGGSYLRNWWNVLDFSIIIVSITSIVTGPFVTGICSMNSVSGAELKSLRSLRALRALRPLRAIKRAPGLRLVVNSLFLAFPAIAQVGLVTLLFMTILAILGQQFFLGQVASCNDESADMFTDCFGNFTITGNDCGMLPNQRYSTRFSAEEWSTFADPVKTPLFTLDSIEQCEANGDLGSEFPRVWNSFAVNFDTFGNALTTVYEVASGEMWPDIMATTIDARGIGVKQLPNAHPAAFIWYFLVQFIIAFVMLNVFIGVIIEKYNENKGASDGSGLLTDEQKLWVETMKLALNSRAKRKLLPPVALKPYRMWAYQLTIWPIFDYGIMISIILNVLLMACTHFDQSVQWHTGLTISTWIFNVLFTVEMLIKWWGIGIQYFQDKWNLFDFGLVVLAWIGQTGALPPTLGSLFRIFRVMRMLRLVRNIKGLLKLFKTLIYSIPALLNVGIIMALIMFICANLAMNSFGNVKEGELLTGDANFQTFWLSFNTMWRISSGESYNGIMHDLNIKIPYCSPYGGGRIDPHESNCGNQTLSFLIFQLCFTILNYVLVNLFIAIILDNFADECAMSESSVTAESLEEFDEVWASFDPQGTQKIEIRYLSHILDQVEYPLGVRKIPVEYLHGKSIRKYRNLIIQKLDIPSVDGFINFLQTKKALTENAIGGDLSENVANYAIVKRLRKRKAELERRMPGEATSVTYGVNHNQAAVLVQALYRGRRARKNWSKVRNIFLKSMISKRGGKTIAKL